MDRLKQKHALKLFSKATTSPQMYLSHLSWLFNAATQEHERPALLWGSILIAGSESLPCVGDSSADLTCNAVQASDDSGVYQDTIAELHNIVEISRENLHTDLLSLVCFLEDTIRSNR